MKKYLLNILLFTFSILSFAVEKPLSTSGWHGYADGETTITVTSQNPLVAEINVVGNGEAFPRLALSIPNEDWRMYQKVSFEVLLESPSAAVLDGGKDFVLVLNDRSYTQENTMGASIINQQTEVPHVKAGEWQSVDIDLRYMARKQVTNFILYLYSRPFNFDHSYKVSIRNIRLIGNDAGTHFFDGTDLGFNPMPSSSNKTFFASLQTEDGLKLDFAVDGAISKLNIDGKESGSGFNQASGIMVRDAKTSLPPAMVEGTLSKVTNGVRQEGSIASMNLEVDATYQSFKDRISVSGKVTSTSKDDRSVTVYVALPVAANDSWNFHKGLIHKTQPFADGVNVPQLEDIATEYPIAVLADKAAKNAFGLMLDQKKPIAYRLVVNPKHKLFYAAFDVALLNQDRFDGVSQKSADFQIEIVRTDPDWGFRSGLEKLYTIHADNYVDNLGFSGGWELWSRHDFDYTNEQNIIGGYRFDWNGSANDKDLWEQNVKNNFLNLLYTESEYQQYSMGDFKSPTNVQAAERFNKLLSGDDKEWDAFLKLAYSKNYCGTIHPKVTELRPFLEKMFASAAASMVHGRDGKPLWNLGYRDWIGDSNLGSMLACNISPNIPNGRGSVMRQIGMDALFDEYLKNGWTAPNGFGLDEFMMSPDDYRRENFKYMETPVSFDRMTKQPMVVRGFSSVEWLKKAREDYAAKSREIFFMANCKGSLTFVAPYLDIFGIENTYVTNPEYFRIYAGKKRAITNVSYTPPSKKHIEYNMLWCTYVGRKATYDVLGPIVKMEDQLYAAGWEPITGASTLSADIRIERYGSASSDTIYLVVHNMNTSSDNITITLDSVIFKNKPKAELVYNGSGEFDITNKLSVSFQIGDRETKVLRISKSKYALTWNQEFDLSYGDSDVELTVLQENPSLKLTYISDNPNIAHIEGNILKIKHAGIVKVTASQEGTETASKSEISKTLAIKKKGIEVTALSTHKIIGEDDPELKYSFPKEALVKGDSFTGKLSRKIGESIGTYRIEQGNLAISSDYLINFIEGNFFIQEKLNTLSVVDLILNNGIEPVVPANLKIDNVVVGGIPNQIIISENDGFSLAKWQKYEPTLIFSLSKDKGFKTIYLKVKDEKGNESNVVSRSFYHTPELYAGSFNKAQVIPNPVSSFATVKLNQLDANPEIKNSIKVMSLNGNLLGEFIAEGAEFACDFSSYPSGTLLVLVENKEGKVVIRVIKK